MNKMRTQEFKKDSQIFKIAPTKKKEELNKMNEELFIANKDLPVSHVSLSPEIKPTWKTIG